jgi:CRISPR-associated protein (TIGR02710 family)
VLSAADEREGEKMSGSKAMIISVGGSPAPVVASLNAQRPARVCFFVSAESRASLEAEILPALAYHPAVHDWITIPSAEDLLECYGVLARELPRLAEKWGVPLGEFVADYTGGTKTMSVALALATVQVIGRYSYVGGTERTKAGLGIVVDGKERMLHQANPWDALAVSARQRAALLFARGRYEAAAEEFEAVAPRVSPAEQSFYRALGSLARGYAEWDRFAHEKAQGLLYRSLQVLEPFAAGSGSRQWMEFVALVRGHAEQLRRMAGEDGGQLRVADLIANARRRGDLEARYDDAVARLYSALEMAARVRLEQVHRIRTSEVHRDQVPESLREEFCKRYEITDGERKGCLKLPHYAAFRLLVALQDELGLRYMAREKEVGDLLAKRNLSILAHGDHPVREEIYQRFSGVVREVAAVQEEELPKFPDLPL